MITGFVEQVWASFQKGPNADEQSAETQNMRTVQDLYLAIGRGDYQAFREALAEEVEMEIISPQGAPFSGRWRGREQVTAAVQSNFAQIAEMKPVVDEVVAKGQSVVLSARDRGRYHTGEAFDLAWVQWFTFAGGKLVNFREMILPPP
jgi:ketosteroid isomerase-like protein